MMKNVHKDSPPQKKQTETPPKIEKNKSSLNPALQREYWHKKAEHM